MKLENKLNIRMLDSVNFLPMPLAKLPKSFGLSELKKGYFPHLFNTQENQQAKLDTHPEAHYYSPDTMGTSQREAFYEWFEVNKNKPFDFQKEIVDYCISDVDILRRAMTKFRTLVRKITGKKEKVVSEVDLAETFEWMGAVDPLGFVTIASVCSGIFRSKFLPETWKVLLKENALPECTHEEAECQCQWTEARKLTTQLQIKRDSDTWIPEDKCQIESSKFVSSPIALLPNVNVLGKDVYSKVSLEWLAVKERELGVSIQTALSTEGEKKVSIILPQKGKKVQLKLDGYCVINKVPQVFEFYGCSFHGCPTCYKLEREKHKIFDKTLGQRYRDTLYREKLLKDQGFQITSIWGCEFEKLKSQNPNLLQDIDIDDSICLKDCYFGGRTNALVLHKKFGPGEKGHYLDFTSLYPAVLKYNRYPVGHPVRIVSHFKKLIKVSRCTQECQCLGHHWKLPYFGIMKVTLLPPQNLHIPVLPVRMNGKLKFPLCYTCALKESKEECKCSKEERQFTQTYCSPEIEVALNQGYTLVKIHQVLHWEKTEIYNPETKTGGLFTQYINTFLKLKQEASGYPPEVSSEEEKEHYIDSYFEEEGIELTEEKIKPNPGLRSLCKLALNSFYGKFGQRMDQQQEKFVDDMGEMFNLLTDPTKTIINWHILNENLMLFYYKRKEEFDSETIVGNVVIAAFCTCWARLKLWGAMKKLGNRVLYHDTDSIIFSAKEGEYMPSTGSYLGQFTDELLCKEVGCSEGSLCKGHWIEEFVSCGPKNYAYKLNTGHTFCKVRGFCLNHQNSQVLNFESMKQSLFSWHRNEPEQYETVSTMILRNQHQPQVFNRTISKKYGVVYDKRQVLPNLTTLPYGFRS
jgi:G:T-mismatch repair DNA endonuclease (very short patch repair protein)